MIKKIANDWRVKVGIQNLVGLIPGRMGFALNERLTRFIRGSIVERDEPTPRILKGLNNFKVIREKTGFDFAGKTILEYGTGWHGIDLLLLHLLGVDKIYTLDHYQYLELENMMVEIPYFDAPEVLDKVKAIGDPATVDRRWEAFKTASEEFTGVAQLLEHLNIEYFIAKSCLSHHLPIEKKSIDMFYSESILQRIPEKDLISGLQHISEHLLKPEAIIFHKTDQNDINLQHNRNNPDGARLHYLQYSDFVFKNFISGRFNSQNRLRESDFIDIFNKQQINILFLESYYKEADLPFMEQFKPKLAKRFRDKSVQDIVTAHSRFIGQLQEGKPQDQPINRVFVQEV